MKYAAIASAILFFSSASSLAASPDALWQQYQNNPSAVSTQPVKPAPKTEHSITIATQNGNITAKQPTTADAVANTAAVKTKDTQADTQPAAEDADAENAQIVTENIENVQTAAQPAAATIVNPVPAQAQLAADNPTAAQTAVIAKTTVSQKTVVSTTPTVPANKPKPKLSLVGKPPVPKQFMRTPQASDFAVVTSTAGGYSLAVPASFGANPLAQLPNAEGAMLVRTASNMLMLAATMLDAADTESFAPAAALPAYADARLYCQWQHVSSLSWNCHLSRHTDYHGDKLILQAETKQNSKTYQLLFVMPKAKYDTYLPQAMYALDSFKLL